MLRGVEVGYDRGLRGDDTTEMLAFKLRCINLKVRLVQDLEEVQEVFWELPEDMRRQFKEALQNALDSMSEQTDQTEHTDSAASVCYQTMSPTNKNEQAMSPTNKPDFGKTLV